MKKISTIILSLLLAAVFTLPVFARAATSPGVKPGNFFYFFDTSFEKIGLFFTFNPEKKARRALQYADERLAEIEVIAEEKDTDAVKTAISNYENNVALAAEQSKEVTDKAKAESLLTSIEDKTEKNQEVLSVVLSKVPEDAREAILRAISASRKGQEEAAKQIAELKGEVEKLKQEVEELKTKDEEREKVIEELGKQKTEKSAIQQKTFAPASVAPTPKPEQSQTSPKTSIVTLPSGAVVEIDVGGNIIRRIKEAEPVEASSQYQPSQFSQPIQNTQSATEQYYAELIRQQEEKKNAVVSITNEYNSLLQSYKTCLTQGETIGFVIGNCGGLHSQLQDMYYQLLLLGATSVQIVPALPHY